MQIRPIFKRLSLDSWIKLFIIKKHAQNPWDFVCFYFILFFRIFGERSALWKSDRRLNPSAKNAVWSNAKAKWWSSAVTPSINSARADCRLSWKECSCRKRCGSTLCGSLRLCHGQAWGISSTGRNHSLSLWSRDAKHEHTTTGCGCINLNGCWLPTFVFAYIIRSILHK